MKVEKGKELEVCYPDGHGKSNADGHGDLEGDNHEKKMKKLNISI